MDVITTHLNADFDCLASMVAAKKLYPHAQLVFPGSQERNVRDFLRRMDFPLEVASLKTINFDMIRRLIIVDTKQADRIGEFATILHKPALTIHLYDHHPGGPKDFEAEVEVVEDVGATTTIFARLLQERGLGLTPMEATVMALGIYEDTGSLTFTSTSAADLRAAADLLSAGADLSIVAEFVNRELNPTQVRLLHELMQSARELVIEGTALTIAKASSERYIGDAAYIVHKWKEMANLDVVFALIRMDAKIQLVARSRGDRVNVAQIAAEFGGGGHPYAASASIKDLTLNDAEETLVSALYRRIREVHVARLIMSSPVLSIAADTPVQHTQAVLDGATVNTLLVLQDGKPIGYITRQIVQRAMYHRLTDEPIAEYMLTDLRTVTPDAPFSDVELLMLQRPQKILPVVNADGEAIGVITKNDILKVLQERKLEEISYHSDPGQAHARNVRRLMEERLPADIWAILRQVGALGDEFGYAVYVVGGFARDLLLRVEEHLEDLDIVVEGDGLRFVKALARRCDATAKIHRTFRTGIVIFPNGFKVDVATARTEHYEYPAAMPVVRSGSLRLDMYRRDFTVNALAIRLNTTSFGQVYDYFGGQRDLKEKVIRVLHSLSFIEDPTRIFRAVRFEQRFRFRMDGFTLNQIKNAVKKDLVQKLSGRRIYNELLVIFKEPNPVRILERLHELGVLAAIHPQLKSIDEMRQTFGQIRAVIAWYQLLYRDESINEAVLYLLALIDQLDTQAVKALCAHFMLKQKIAQIVLLARNGYTVIERPLLDAGADTPTAGDIYHVFHDLPLESILYWMAKTKQEAVKKAASAYFTRLRDITPTLTGKDLLRMGLPPGPIFQRILKDLLNDRLNGRITTPEQERALAQEKIAAVLRDRDPTPASARVGDANDRASVRAPDRAGCGDDCHDRLPSVPGL